MKVVIHSRYEKYADYLKSIPARMDRGEGICLHNGRNKVVLFEHQGLRIVAKRFKDANFIQRMAYTYWRPTKASRAYHYAARLRERGVDTPHEIAFFEDYPGGLFRSGWFLCEACQDTPVFSLLSEVQDFDRRLASDVAAQVAFMHRKGIFFGDLNLGNFLCRRQEDGGFHFTMVDTNRSRFSEGALPLKLCIENLRTVTHRRDLYAFILQEYAQVRGLNQQQVLAQGMACLDKFESRIARKYYIKGLLHIGTH